MTVTVNSVKRAGRPKTEPADADEQLLQRICSLAMAILTVIRAHDGRYESETVLRQWLTDAGFGHTTGDVAKALDLLEALERVVRPSVLAGLPRPGSLPEVGQRGIRPVSGPTDLKKLADAVEQVFEHEGAPGPALIGIPMEELQRWVDI